MPFLLARQPPAQIISDAHLINNLSHVLHALILQSGELEKLCCLPHVHHVVLAQSLRQGFAAEALQTRQQIHVGHAQHVKHTLCHQLHGKTQPAECQTTEAWRQPIIDIYKCQMQKKCLLIY